jgi:lipopolysaccharide export system permease protein
MMSLAMLEHYQDSFETEINKIYNGLENTLVTRTYTSNRRLGPRPVDPLKEKDTVIYRLNLDSIYLDLTNRNRAQAVESALSQARASMNYISTSETNSSSKVTRLRRYQIEIHRKFTLSIACLIFFFIGAPLGAIIRKGGLGMPTVISVFFFLIWYILSMSGEQLARDSAIAPAIGMWLSSAILIPIGIWLTYKSMTDSALLNMETYSSVFRKLARRIRYLRIKMGLS